MERLLEDLQFFIGAFFIIVGAILFFEGITSPVYTSGFNLNAIVGAIFLALSIIPTWISIRRALRP